MASSDNRKSNYNHAYQLKRYVGFTFILCLGTILSILAFIIVLKGNTNRLQKEFIYESSIHVTELRNNFNYYLGGLELLQSFFLSSDNVRNDEFSNFVEPLLRRQNFHTILWVKAVESNQINSLKATYAKSAAGYTDFTTTHPDLSLQQYPEIIKSIQTSYSKHSVELSDLFSFIDKKNSKNNIAFIYPIIKNNKVSSFIVSILDLEKSLPNIFHGTNKRTNPNVYIYETDESGFEKLIYSSEKNDYIFGERVKNKNEFDLSTKMHAAFTFSDHIELLSKKWHIINIPSTEYVAMAVNWLPWTVLSFGIMLTVIIGLFLFHLIGRNIEVSKEVIQRTQELSDNETRLKAVMNTVLDGIVTINSGGIIESFNPAAERIFGYNSSDIIGKNIAKLMPEPDSGHHDTYLHNYLDSGIAKIIGIGREVMALRQDKSVFPMELSISEMQVEGKRMFVGLIRDITIRKETETQLDDARRKAEHANHAKSEFLATMSHEIRTPLNGILGMAELLSNMNLSEKEKRYVGTILSSGELLLVLINDVLDFSKIEAGELILEKIPVVIRTLLSEVTQLLCSRASENNVELTVQCPHDIPLAILADPVRLQQILINLLGNAIKFTSEGHVLINVSKQYSDKNQICIRFEVIDTGIGIEQDKITNIFDQFSQADSSTTRKFGGTGLGLAICKKLVEKMGGEISVQSVVGQGSKFWFDLEFEVHTDFTEINLGFTRQLKDLKILIVDDYLVNLEIYTEYLKNIGIKCDIAVSAAEGLSKMHDTKDSGKAYDIAIIDYQMPQMDGIKMGEIIKNRPDKYGNPQLILLTALDKSESLQHINTSGFCSHIIKPIYPNMLAEAIIKAMALRTKESPQISTFKNNVITSKIKRAPGKFSITALVVDDFPSNVEVAKEMLEKVGCTVFTATNGSEALEILTKDPEKYDVIFMDCQMPVMDGFTTTHNIRSAQWGKKIPIIAVTANTTKDIEKKCLSSGMDNYISKPMKISNIKEMLRKYFPNQIDAA